MWKHKKEFEFILRETLECLDEVHENLSSPYITISKLSSLVTDGKMKKQLEIDKVYLADAFSKIEKYLDLMRSIDEDYKTNVEDNLINLSQQNTELVNQISLLEASNNKLDAKNKELLTYLLEVIDKYNNLVTSLNNNMSEFNSRIDNSINQIALNNYIRSDEFKQRDRSGKNCPRYRQDVKNDELVEKYKSGMKPDELAKYYNMSSVSIIARLKTMGVYVDGRKKK